MSLDLVTLVDEHDNVIGEMDKVEAHHGEAKRHRASSVYLFRKNGNEIELLIQQRSSKKIVGANWWANTVCGNVRPAESYEECAYRRLKEELGIVKVQIKPIYKFEYHLQCNAEFSEWEVDQVFIGWYEGEVQPNPDEVQDFSWVKWSELLEKAEKAKIEIKNFNTKIIEFDLVHSGSLDSARNSRSDLTNLKTILVKSTLAPWFVWMLNDEKLIQEINL